MLDPRYKTDCFQNKDNAKTAKRELSYVLMSKMAEKQEALREESIQGEGGESIWNEGANRDEEVGEVRRIFYSYSHLPRNGSLLICRMINIACMKMYIS